MEKGRFMMDIHSEQDLAPRDVVARAIHEQLLAGEKVYLNIEMIQNFEQRFPTVSSICKTNGVDINKNLFQSCLVLIFTWAA